MSRMGADLEVFPEEVGGGLAAIFMTDGLRYRVHVEVDVPVSRSLTPLLPVAVLVGMRQGKDVQLHGPVDRAALKNSGEVRELMARWYPDIMRPVSIRADSQDRELPAADGVGCFFSGGVDSFYSALKNRERLSHLIFVKGFDIPLDDEVLGEKAARAARLAAAELGLPLIEVATDVRGLSDPTLDWGAHFHGAALAMVALSLSHVLGEVIIPASYAESDLFAWGSHPDLDPAYSSGCVRLTHDGTVSRVEKVQYLTESSIAMSHLRVCWENRGGAFNCGQCEKCLRTMINLRVAGGLERCATLPHRLSLRAVSRLGLSHGGAVFARENIRRMSGADRSLAWALRLAILRSHAKFTLLRTPLGQPVRRLLRGRTSS